MGKIEAQSARRRKRHDIGRAILGTVQAVGVVSFALIAPNTIAGLQKLGIIPKRRQSEYIRTSLQRLIDQGLLVVSDGSVRLTAKGESALSLLEASEFHIKTPRRWDGRWRVLIFDVPERKRQLRVRLTATLRSAGFVRLQDSVWVHPFDCEDMFQLFKTELGIRSEVLYIIADTIENDAKLRQHFKLPRT